MLYAQSSPQMQVLLRDGQAALDRGYVERAVQDFEQARQLAPENLHANRGLLLSYLQAGRLNEAAQLGVRRSRIGPTMRNFSIGWDWSILRAGKIPLLWRLCAAPNNWTEPNPKFISTLR
jgi:hypothetical protein